ncbi:MAG: MarR family transcriptional regulator [Sphingomonadaceae bacterium]|nr:MarR family transcriptional regulator [Sphingomonadaceae bacterium]
MADAVVALRAFNRFHTRFAGALDRNYLGSDLTLVEARVLYELVNRAAPLAASIRADLGLDAGYLSRIVRRFETRGWITRGRGKDARERPVIVGDAGRAAFAALDARTLAAVEASLAHMLDADRAALTAALDLARTMLGGGRSADYAIRPFRTGDMGLITARQSMLYDEGYGWGTGMEALIGEVTARFLRDFRSGREQCWIAEIGGAMAGSVFLVDAGDNVARLRLLYVEPWARGRGIGEAMVNRCIELAREAGYREIVLWTHTVLTSARRIYDALGFRIRSVEVHDEFGKPEQGETWAMPLDG